MKLVRILLLVSVIAALSACESGGGADGDNDNIEGGDDNGTPKEELVELKVQPSDANQVSITVKAEKVVVEWGDGKSDSYTATKEQDQLYLLHDYDNNATRTIKLYPKSLKEFTMSVSDHRGEPLEVVFTDCEKLEKVVASATALDLRAVKSIRSVDISDGEYTKEEIDAIFSKLPVWSGSKVDAPVISVNDEHEYTASIAVDKGWIVEEVVGPKTEVEEDNLFGTEKGFMEAISGCYLSASDWFRDLYMFEGLYSHTIDLKNIQAPSKLYTEIYNRDLTSNDYIYFSDRLWAEAYNIIANCNNMIENAEQRGGVFAKYGYTARALRSFIYYQMINLWGDLRYMTKFSRNVVPFSSATEVADKLIADLKNLETVALDEDKELLFSKDDIRAVLAKVYLWRGDKANALQCAKQIISSNRYSLYPKEEFSKIYQSNDNREKITPLFVQFIKDTDMDSYRPLIKVQGELPGQYFIPTVRYAEIFLIAAEAATTEGEKIEYVNRLRERNGRELLSSKSTARDIENALTEEYRLDLGNEGVYLFYLKRTGIASKVLGVTPPDVFFEIPQAELEFGGN